MNRVHIKLARRAVCRVAAFAVLAVVLSVPATVRASDTLTPFANGAPGAVVGHGPSMPPGPPAPPGPPGQPGPPAAGQAGSGSNMTYHGGPVMHSNTTHLIFWSPANDPMPANYQAIITKYFTDVAAASGQTTNVYSADPQYTDTSGTGAAYNSTYAGSWTDSTTITNHCTSEYTGSSFAPATCVLDSDIQSAVTLAIADNPGWTPGPTSMYFVFTPPNVGSCFTSTDKDCAYTSYCAYHDYFVQGGANVIYANMPYTDTSGLGPKAWQDCDSGEHPNGDFADATISVASHEHNEAITDPLVNAWYDAQGNEIGDKCAWNFGTPLGGSAGSEFNQVINGDDYYVQMEWNNATSSCVQRIPPGAPTISSFTPTSGAASTAVTITGTNLTGATSVKFHGTSATFSVSGDGTSISTSVPMGATSGTITVTTPGGTATSSASFTVPLPPAPSISGFSPGSGGVGAAVTINGSNFGGATAVKFGGTSATFSVGASGTSISTTVPASAKTGAITVTTAGGTATSATSFTVLLPDFTVAVSPASQSVARGHNATCTVTITRLNGFTGSVQLSVSGLPAGVTGSFNPGTISAAGTTSTLTVATKPNSKTGTSTLTVTGASGTLKHTATANLTIS